MEELCVWCGRICPEVVIALDVPLPFVPDAMGRRWHVGCLADHVLPMLAGGQMAALRVMHATERADRLDRARKCH